MNETTKPNRRWYQFSLRTMLVVMVLASAAFGGWVHQARDWIRQRHEALESRLAMPVQVVSASPFAPGGLCLFGETGYVIICIASTKSDTTDDENEAKVRSLFPEATIMLGPRW